MQGLGFALIEEMVWDGARLANPTLMDYKIPTFAELPESLRAYIVESMSPPARSAPRASARSASTPWPRPSPTRLPTHWARACASCR